jgi:hypothetical protein
MSPSHDLDPDPSPLRAVREVILEPMEGLYDIPFKLRHDEAARKRALADYETLLSRFDRGILAQAWKHVLAVYQDRRWPTPGVFAAACEMIARRHQLPTAEESRKAKALDMAEAYTSRYMKTSHLAKLARREGWAGPLRAYVADVAHVQAQLICGVCHIGWNARLADDLGDFHSSAEALAAYAATIEKAVARGQIRVTVPKRRYQQWQNHDLPHQGNYAEAQEACHSACQNSGWRAP